MRSRSAEPLERGRFVSGVLWSLLAAAFAAGFLVPYRMAVESAPRLSAMTAMFAVAALFNGAVAAAQTGARGFRVDRLALITAALLTACTVAGNAAIATALPAIGAGMTSVVMKSQVILTPLFAAWFLSEAVPQRLWSGIVLALVGFVAPQLLKVEEAGEGWGYVFAFVAALAFAAMQIITRRVIHRIHAASVNTVRLVMAVASLHLLPEGRAVWALPVETWCLAGLAGIFGPGISRLCLMAALRYVSPSFTALVALIGPVLAFGLGFAFFDEAPTALELAGAGLILFGVLLAAAAGVAGAAARGAAVPVMMSSAEPSAGRRVRASRSASRTRPASTSAMKVGTDIGLEVHTTRPA